VADCEEAGACAAAGVATMAVARNNAAANFMFVSHLRQLLRRLYLLRVIAGLLLVRKIFGETIGLRRNHLHFV